jgi:23S rRNA (pseudouridine1915-N3)-methyltransferase
MKVSVHAVGRMKAGPERELADRYFGRFTKAAPAIGLEFAGVGEIPESRAGSPAERQRDEAARLRERIGADSTLILLDERGKNFSSEEFAEKLRAMRDQGGRSVAIVIGGPDGHEASLRESAALTLSFGRLTWPHQFARVMLAEQLYRAATILSGHPYHRA